MSWLFNLVLYITYHSNYQTVERKYCISLLGRLFLSSGNITCAMMDFLSMHTTEINLVVNNKLVNTVRVVLQQLDKINPYFISSMAVGYQLEVQMPVQLVAVLFVNVPLTITLHVVDVLIAECLSWFVIVVRYDLICFLCHHFCLCTSPARTILKKSVGGGKCTRK